MPILKPFEWLTNLTNNRFNLKIQLLRSREGVLAIHFKKYPALLHSGDFKSVSLTYKKLLSLKGQGGKVQTTN